MGFGSPWLFQQLRQSVATDLEVLHNATNKGLFGCNICESVAQGNGDTSFAT